MKFLWYFKNASTISGFFDDIEKIKLRFKKKAMRRALDLYLQYNSVPKLIIGAGTVAVDGWFNTDLKPQLDTIYYMDAASPFPIDNSVFEYVFSEHLIEHLTRQQGSMMLKECFRVLKPGGKIRIATPNLEVLLGLYHDYANPLAQEYIKWITDKSIRVSVYKPSIVINNAFHNWGHQFLYDGELLEMGLRDAGFMDIRQYTPRNSDDSNLKNLEIHGMVANNQEMNNFETMVFEAVRPY
jgi:predicted SAM-dependent methyltransferase